MITATTTATEMFDYFRAEYMRELKDRLLAAKEDDRLDYVLRHNQIDGDILTGCDQTAYAATIQNYGWRIGEKEISELFGDAGADVYVPIDYDALIAVVRAA
jgi:hypothetical protein